MAAFGIDDEKFVSELEVLDLENLTRELEIFFQNFEN